ncbi:PKHD1L1 [Branchiostoma lanceolatum]|uniref:PKHD1L1 protein n=1 Tax=Branchiostoma lanceolatum TaxID=7740 RepID=A0A8K0ECR9_BRALA|nr:PKHD1L1 [Branchiostoma lanceolatum]
MASGRVATVLVVVLALTLLQEAQSVTIDSVSPNTGGTKGGTRMKIFGSDLPTDFSMDFDILTVNFVSATQSYACAVERTSVSRIQIECYTSAMPLGQYTPEVTVCTSANSRDCTAFRCQDPDTCTFETTNWRTPFIKTVTPNTGYPGSMFTAYGKIITCLYGSDKAACTNGRTESIVRYGIVMDNDGASVWGNMEAKLQGNYVGHQNISIIVNGAFGRSDSLWEAKQLGANMKMNNFETYAKLSSVSPGTGSELGRSTITIGGEWFDSSSQNAVVTVGGEECIRPSDFTDEEIVCLTPAKPANEREFYPGNRGVNKDYWSYADPAAMPALTDLPTGDPSETEWGDSTSWGAREGSFISRSRFFFKPPNDNTYQFVLFDCNKPADDFLLRVEDASGEVSEWGCPAEGRGYSPRIPLAAANSYYVEAWYRHDASAGGDSEADKRLSMKMFSTNYVGGQNHHARNEKQKIKITSTVHRETQFISSGGSAFTISHDGVTSASISAGASAGEVQQALQPLYQNQCPEEVANPIGAITKYATGFEDGRNPITGTVVKADETMPFCGGKSLMNPTTVYQADPENDFYPIKISIEKMVCFAYKGSLDSRVFLRYDHGSDGEAEASGWFGPDDHNSLDFSSSEEWQYTCFDFQEIFASARPDATNVKVKEMRFRSASEESDFFIDNLFIGKTEPTAPGDVAGSVRQAAMPNDVFIDEVQVAEENGGYSVSFIPFNCGFNLPLMASDQGGVTITREQAASPPVQGTFGITFSGETSTVKAEATEEEMANKLKLDLGIEAKVTLGGDCSGQTWEVEWVTAGGNQAELELDGSSLTGDDVAIEVKTLDDGGLWFYSIPGSMTRTAHGTPQVEVSINGIPSRCEGGCGFSWAADRTPTVTSISPQQGTGGTEVTITGTGFSANCNDLRVRIGRSEDTEEGVACTPSACTETSITCTAGSGGQGSQRVKVKVLPRGDDPGANPNGKASGDVSFTYLGGITSISPTTSGLGGGVPLTITGNGFADDDSPKVGENDCPVVSRSDTEIVCMVPFGSSAGAVDVTVSGSDVLTSSDQFTYDEALSPIITTYSPEEITVAGGETLTLDGTGFGDSPELTLDCDSETVRVEASVTDTGSVTATLPPLSPGECDILLFVPGSGYAMVEDNTRKRAANGRFKLPQVNVNLKVTGMDPSRGSLYGGTEVTISGEGFSEDTADVEVKFGDTDCEVLTSSANEITCRTESTAVTHTVNNDGSHPEFGTGFAWDPATLTVAVGDTVVWGWTASGSDTKYGVHQTTDSTGEVLAGFSSGEQTSSGAFSYTFKETGSFFYTSGCVDLHCDIKMLGRVDVVDRTDVTEALSLKVHGWEAEQRPNDASGRRRSSGSCPGGTGSLLDCSGDPPAAPEGAVFSFSFLDCMTSEVSSVSDSQGTAGTVLTLQGTGFSIEACENEVLIGEHQCEVETASADTLTCRVAPGNDMPVGTALPVSLDVKNRGEALMAAEGTFALLPIVTSLSPQQGSTEGGTTVTISGSGFTAETDGTAVMIGSSGCDVESVSYNEIVCTTQAASALTRDVVVTQGGSLRAVCDGDCQFSHRDSSTPRLVSIQPTSASGASNVFTLTGALFGTDVDAVAVEIGDTPCDVTAMTDGSITCTARALAVGSNAVSVVNALGTAASSLTVASQAQIDSFSPPSGSMAGGTVVTFTGNGFGDDMSVTLGDGSECTIDGEITRTSFSCVTPTATQDGDHTVQLSVRSNGQTYPAQDFTYAADRTPVVNSISPSEATGGDTLTISGSGFGGVSRRRRRSSSADVSVTVGDSPCPLSSSSDTELSCVLVESVAGSYDVNVMVAGMGLATSSVALSYQLSLDSVQPTSGSLGGGLTLTLGGSGFSSSTVATVCGEPCPVSSTGPSQMECTLPANNGGSAQVACDVEVEDNGITTSLAAAFTYDSSLTPVIDSVSPSLGGTAGGTTITIAGSNLGGVSSVTIAGSACDITDGAEDWVTCVTGARQGSVEAKVRAEGPNGIATQDNADFYYVDRWSSVYTWGGDEAALPAEGDFIIVEEGQTLLLDTDTPVLKMLLIDGGSLIFYDEMDVHLQAEYILVVNGGLFQVGTEEDPFQHQATITLHGNLRSKELPIYGAKVLAVREGTLDLHGMPVTHTWTLLAETAAAGTDTLVLEQAVTWQAGDSVVIATTGHRHSQGETEVREIQSVSDDGHTVTLTESLEYEHLGEFETVDGVTLSFQAEVGLLTGRTIVVEGSNGVQGWDETIEACPEGFDTGEFVTQTCFQGRFGEETGSDQFGGHVMMHPPDCVMTAITARIEYVEFTNMGQAFRLGRYAVHFHLNCDKSNSYVRGNSIHHSFNRAVVVHGTDNLLVEHNVIYDIMGGAIFIEDGIETGNVIQYNFLAFVRSSTSLLNDDIMPAAMWLLNPNNTVQHNHVAGGTHFGAWYALEKHVHGASFDPENDFAPIHVPLGVFYNNTFHSQGWFGLWIFEDYFPTKDGSQWGEPEPAVFRSLTAWRCEKGAEVVNGGAITLTDFTMVDNEKAGIEWKRSKNVNDWWLSQVTDSFIVGHTALAGADECTQGGIKVPFGPYFGVEDTTLVNFDRDGAAAIAVVRIDGTCNDLCSGFVAKTSGINFSQSPNKVSFEWEHESVLWDVDGSLTGTAGGSVVPSSAILPLSCTESEEFSVGRYPGSVCTDPAVKLRRFALNNAQPVATLEARDLILTNDYGSTSIPWAHKRMTHPMGWMADLVEGEVYSMYWEYSEHLVNISYDATFYQLMEDEYIIINHVLAQSPDRFTVIGDDSEELDRPIDPATDNHGAWHFDESTKVFSYLVKGSGGGVDRPVSPRVYRCAYEDCIAPIDPAEAPPSENRPDDYSVYGDADVEWNELEDGFLVPSLLSTPDRKRSALVPTAGVDLRIDNIPWLVLGDNDLPALGQLHIVTVLELWDPNQPYTRDYTLQATHIFIQGGRLVVGWPDEPYLGNVLLSLLGDHSTPDMPLPSGPNVGAKAVGVFGGLDLFGNPRNPSWTELAQTANAGDNTITLQDPVDWQPGEEIVISPTGFSTWETETFTILGVSDDMMTLTLDSNLQYRHIYSSETFSGKSYTIAAEVALFNRNIQIEGAAYADQDDESFGARVLVGSFNTGGQTYTGYARLSNVEFVRTGQEGWTASYDPRYSLAFLDLGDIEADRASFIDNSVMHSGYAPGLGVFGTNNLNVTNNVIHHTVGQGAIVEGRGSLLYNNLMVQSIWPGSYQDRYESKSEKWEAALEIQDATHVVLQGNHIAGAERIGIHMDGEPCTDADWEWRDNVIHTALQGIHLYEDGQPGCSLIRNFVISKCWSYGLYFQSESSAVVEDMTFVDNGNGFFSSIIKPPSLSHVMADKSVTVRDSLFVGRSTEFDCDADVVDVRSDDNLKIASGVGGLGFGSSKGNSGGFIGMSLPGFNSGPSGSPLHPWDNQMAYTSLGGHTLISGVNFANYKEACGGKEDVALHTWPGNEDGTHAFSTEDISTDNVDNPVFYDRPNVGKINPSDCVDMSCDGKLQVLGKDLDGTLLGETRPGAVIAQSDWEWDGDARYGRGDYRIPKTMLADLSGNKIDPSVLAPNGPGIVRNDECEKSDDMQAYKCWDIDYGMLVMESMDADTETRRLSPVAMLSNGYIDLINGPQDHGWCAGYTCSKRISTFMGVVALGQDYLIHFSGVSPRESRYFMLNADDDDTLVVGIYFSNPERLDVYVDDVYVLPKNDAGDGKGTVLAGDHYPTHQDAAGANFMKIEEQTLYFTIKGSTIIDIKTSDVITIAFGLPPITVDDFFGDNLAENLCLFLNIPRDKIRRMNVVSEGGKRRRRAAGGVTVQLQIGDSPGQNVNSTAQNSLTYDQLKQLEASLVDALQTGALSSVLGVNVTSAAINGPVAPVGSEEWSQLTVDPAVSVTYATPSSLRVVVEPEPLHEGAGFSVQPKIQALDAEGNVIIHLGYTNSPWEITATLQLGEGSDARALLKGSTSVPYVNGWANFTDLQITHSGEGYTIHFTVSQATQTPLLVFSQSLTVATMPVTVGMLSQPETVPVNQPFSMQMELRDAVTGQALPDIAWKGMTWAVTVSLVEPFPGMYNGSLSGETTATFNPLTGYATFVNLQLSDVSRYQLEFLVTNDQNMAEYDFTYSPEPIDVFPVGFELPGGVEKRAQITFDADFSTVQEHETHFEIFMMNELNAKYSNVYISAVDASAGSIIVDFTVTGPEDEVDAVLLRLWEAVNQPMTVTFAGSAMETVPIMFVNRERYYGTGVASGEDVILIACITTVSALAVIFIAAILIWKCKKSAEGGKKMGRGWSDFRPTSAIFRPSSAASLIKVKQAHFNQPPVVLSSFNPLKSVEENMSRKNFGFSMEEETRLGKDIESRPVSWATASPTPRPTSPPGYVEDEDDDTIPMPRNMKVKLLDKTYRRVKLGRTWIDMKKTLDQARQELLIAFPAQLGGKDFRFMTANLTHVVQEVESEFHLKDIIDRDCDVIALHEV